MDPASYAAGEAAAYSRAFSAALPSQQALGQLFQAVDTLHERLEADAAAATVTRDQAISAAAAAGAAQRRLDALDATALPALSRRCEDLASRPPLSPEVLAALTGLRVALTQLTASQQAALEAAVGLAARPRDGYLVHQLKALAATAAGYASAALSRADVAALVLSRCLLIGHVAVANDATVSSAPAAPLRTKLRTLTGVALFVAAVEAAWQGHEAVSRRLLPVTLRPLDAPLRAGLRAARVVAWSAAFVLAAAEGREACAAAARHLLGGAPGAPQPPSPAASPALGATLVQMEAARFPPRGTPNDGSVNGTPAKSPPDFGA